MISTCMELGVPIFQGRIDKTLFQASVASTPHEGFHAQLRPS